jgi:hypothetical protein
MQTIDEMLYFGDGLRMGLAKAGWGFFPLNLLNPVGLFYTACFLF